MSNYRALHKFKRPCYPISHFCESTSPPTQIWVISFKEYKARGFLRSHGRRFSISQLFFKKINSHVACRVTNVCNRTILRNRTQDLSCLYLMLFVIKHVLHIKHQRQKELLVNSDSISN